MPGILRKTTMWATAAALCAWACGGEGGDGANVDGSAETATHRATLVGQIDPQVMRELGDPQPFFGPDVRVEVDDVAHDLPLDEEAGFAFRELPTGDVVIRFEIDDMRGVIEIDDVEPDEVVEVHIAGGDGVLDIRVERRDRPAEPDPFVVPPAEGPLVIRGNGGVYRFGPGPFLGDVVVRGNGVKLIGACGGEPTVIDGALEVRGNGVRVIDIAVLGGIDVRGNGFRMTESPCGFPFEGDDSRDDDSSDDDSRDDDSSDDDSSDDDSSDDDSRDDDSRDDDDL